MGGGRGVRDFRVVGKGDVVFDLIEKVWFGTAKTGKLCDRRSLHRYGVLSIGSPSNVLES